MMTVPLQLRQWESYISSDINKMEMMKLSSNKSDINERIKSSSNELYGPLNPHQHNFAKHSKLGRNAGVTPALRTKHTLAVARGSKRMMSTMHTT